MSKIILALSILILPLSSMADWPQQEKRINFLLSAVSKVDGYFIRNGTKHKPKKAVEHLRMKLNNAISSWFAPKKEKWTAEMFIDKVASKSSLSGKPYQIEFSDGTKMKAQDWLMPKLKEYSEQIKTNSSEVEAKASD